MDRTDPAVFSGLAPVAAVTPSIRAGTYALIFFVCILASYLAGKDLNWDLFNYHIYAGHTVLDGSLAHGYFPASWQAYLNPYPHVPFYWMVKHGVNPALIGAALASFHALNLIFIFEIAVILNRRTSGKIVWWAVGLAMFFAFVNPIFLQELGTSFIEVSTSVFVLAGWYGLVRAHEAPRLRWIALSGLLIGVGIAFKMTNAYFSVTALPLLLLLPASRRFRFQAVLAFAAGGVAGVLLAGGWWGWQLWEMFRNPVFPMFNNLFGSPDFVPEAIKHFRFIPISWQETLLKPWEMLLPIANVYTETAAPDLRYAAILLFPIIFLGKFAVAKWRCASAHQPLLVPYQHNRALLALCISLALAWVLWLPTSGNGRYFLPMATLSSVVLAAVFARFSPNRRVIVYGLMVLVGLQATQTILGSSPRWAGTAWGNNYLEVEVPKELRDKPSLHLVINDDSGSFIVPWLAKGSSMISISGQIALARNQRVSTLIDGFPGRVRVMRLDLSGGKKLNVVMNTMNFYLAPFDLQVDQSDCQFITFRHGMAAILKTDVLRYLSCITKPLGWSNEEWANYAAKKEIADRIFDQIEDLCPRAASPRRVVTEGDGTGFIRHYVNTDTALMQLQDGNFAFRDMFRRGRLTKLGHVKDLQLAMPPAIQLCPPLRPPKVTKFTDLVN